MSTTVLGRKNDYADLSTIDADELNGVADDLEWIACGYLALNVAGGVDVTLTETQYERNVLELSGLLTANINLILPAHAGRRWKIYNNTTGAYTITAKTSGGAGIVVTQGYRTEVGCDGTDIDRLSGEISGSSDNRVNAGSLVVGGGTALAGILSATATWDPASIADGDDLSTTIAVTGAAVGDPVVASLSTMGTNDVLISAHVQAANTVRVILLNRTGGALDLASGTLRVTVFKY